MANIAAIQFEGGCYSEGDAAIDARVGAHVAVFPDDAAKEAVYNSRMMLDPSGGLKAVIKWRGKTATSGTVEWDVSCWAVADDEPGETESYAAIQTATDTAGGTALDEMTVEINLSNDDGVVQGEGFRLKLTRDYVSDSMSGDALLCTVSIEPQ